MLKDPHRRLGPLDRANVTLALENAKKTASASGRRAALKAARVVGATCHSCAGRTLAKLSFSVVVLDECSQMTMPASLVPLLRLRARRAIVVGDPKQVCTWGGSRSRLPLHS